MHKQCIKLHNVELSNVGNHQLIKIIGTFYLSIQHNVVFHIKVLGSKVLVYFNLKVNKMFLKMPGFSFFRDVCVQEISIRK